MFRFIIFSILGLATIALSGFQYTKYSRHDTSLNISSNEFMIVYGFNRFIGPEFIATEIIFDYPENIKIGEAFVITARFTVDHVNSNIYKEHTPTAAIGRVKAVLNLGGAKVSPSIEQEIGNDLEAMWSVTIPQSGKHQGFLSLQGSYSSLTVQVVGPEKFEIDVITEKDYIRWNLSLAGILLGILISVTNIIVFYWNWRDRTSARKKDEERIILLDRD